MHSHESLLHLAIAKHINVLPELLLDANYPSSKKYSKSESLRRADLHATPSYHESVK